METANGSLSLRQDFPLLAIRAASELDDVIQGRSGSLENVRLLGIALKESFRPESTGRDIGFVDSGSIAVVSQAVEQIPGWQATTLNELVDRALQIASTLENARHNEPATGLKSLRDLCVALSKAAASFQQAFWEPVTADAHAY